MGRRSARARSSDFRNGDTAVWREPEVADDHFDVLVQEVTFNDLDHQVPFLEKGDILLFVSRDSICSTPRMSGILSCRKSHDKRFLPAAQRAVLGETES